MADKDELARRALSNFVIALIAGAIGILTTALAFAEETSAALNETKSAELTITTTEFKFTPAKVWVIAGRTVTLVLDNSGAETEHSLVVPAFSFRLKAKAGEVVRRTIVFDKPSEYQFLCELPGHRELGMKGTLIVGRF